MTTRTVGIKSQQELADIFGPYDGNINRIKKKFGVSVKVRKNRIEIQGPSASVDAAAELIENGAAAAYAGKKQGLIRRAAGSEDTVYTNHKGIGVYANSPAQRKYVGSMSKNPVTIAMGPAGTGKTFLAVACGLSFITSGRFSKLIISRPVVEAGEKLGFLPGDFEEKVSPYLTPIYDAFNFLAGPRTFSMYKSRGMVEIVPLAYMRGRTLDNAFIILDEAQNTTHLQMKMLLTRLGPHAAMAVNGDETQIDLGSEAESGLLNAKKILKGIRGINFIKFTKKDVIRHPLVRKIVAAYGRHR